MVPDMKTSREWIGELECRMIGVGVFWVLIV